MKYIDEYRDERIARALVAEIRQRVTRTCDSASSSSQPSSSSTA